MNLMKKHIYIFDIESMNLFSDVLTHYFTIYTIYTLNAYLQLVEKKIKFLLNYLN